MKHIILCADDYGQNAAISQAIIELFEKNRLSATSCMTNSHDWLNFAKSLEPFKDKVDLGLHFNLTEGKPITRYFGSEFPSLGTVIRKAYLRRLDPFFIKDELNAQIDQFVKGVGRLPDFIDGHQHIQQLPVVRDVLLEVYEKRLRKHHTYIRSVKEGLFACPWSEAAYFKKTIIQLCGAFPFTKMLTQSQIPHNASFNGVYDFKNASQYQKLFPRFLKKITDKGLIMCHPGMHSSDSKDSIAAARYQEYLFLKSDAFAHLCQKEGISIGRFYG